MAADQRILALAASLESSALDIERELLVINVDLSRTQECLARYGDIYLAPYRYLVQVRDSKKQRFAEVIQELEKLRLQVASSELLLHSLNAGAGGSLVVPAPAANSAVTVRNFKPANYSVTINRR